MLKSREFVASMLDCDPDQITLIAVTLRNEAPKGYEPKLAATGYFQVNESSGNTNSGKVFSCDLFTPASIKEQTSTLAVQAIWKCESQRFNSDYPELIPPMEECWLTPKSAEEMGISLTSPSHAYEIVIGTPGRYNGKDMKVGERFVTSYLNPNSPDHDVLMKSASHIRIR